jgi:hypothetical protein
VVITGRQIEVEQSARDLVALLWPALQCPDQELLKLRRTQEAMLHLLQGSLGSPD